MRLLLTILALLAPLQTVRAEYRVALLIGEVPASVRSGLQAHGFRCTTAPNENERALRRAVEDWAAPHPHHSTALCWFRGEVREEKIDGAPALCVDGRQQAHRSPANCSRSHAQPGGKPHQRADHGHSDDPRIHRDNPRKLPGRNRRGPGARRAGRPPRNPADLALHTPPRILAGGQRKRRHFPSRHVRSRAAGRRRVGQCARDGLLLVSTRSFLAGSPPNTPGRHPDEDQHPVTIGEGFWIGKYELTRAQKLRNLSNKSIGTHKNHPIEMLHWDDGRAMLRRFTEEERKAGRLSPDWQYTLPSEWQWEHAARASTATRFYFGEDLSELPRHANFGDQSYYQSGDIFSNAAHRSLDDGFANLAPVGSFRPNPWGLHDVYGNVAEWCRDKAARGGAWVSVPQNCRSGYRDFYSQRNEQTFLGYRLVIQPNSVIENAP